MGAIKDKLAWALNNVSYFALPSPVLYLYDSFANDGETRPWCFDLLLTHKKKHNLSIKKVYRTLVYRIL